MVERYPSIPAPPTALSDIIGTNAGRRLVEAYAQPTRWYHTLQHAELVARTVGDLGGSRACHLAAWFHDAVYQATAQDNEDRSAQLLEAWLPDDPDTVEAARLVRLTKTHTPAGPEDVQGAILCDADLAVLGAAPPEYERYRLAVRREYAQVPEAEWRTGRAAVLEGLMTRAHLYRTSVGRDRWHDDAHRNMAGELRMLRAGPV